MRIQASTHKRGKGDVRDDRGVGRVALTADNDDEREFLTAIYRILAMDDKQQEQGVATIRRFLSEFPLEPAAAPAQTDSGEGKVTLNTSHNNNSNHKRRLIMKRKLLTILLTISMLAVIAWAPPSAECVVCNQATKDWCNVRSSEAFMDCINLTPYDTYKCIWEGEKAYDACMVIMGCPQPSRILP